MRKLLNNERGATLVLLAIVLVVLMGMAALAIDLGQLYIARQRAQNVCDAAAIAGAWWLDPGVPSASQPGSPADTAAQDCAKASNRDNSGTDEKWLVYDQAYETLPTGDHNAVTVTFPDSKSIRATGYVPVNYAFAGVFGLKSKWVKATALVRLEAVTTVTENLLPIAFPESLTVGRSFGEQIVIKDEYWQDSNIGAGNWRPVSFPGDKGGNDYRTRLGGGGEPVSIGLHDLIGTLPGEKLGPTIQGLDPRLADPMTFDEWQAGYSPWESYTPTDRLVVVPVTKDDYVNGQGDLEIVGFAAFFLESVSQKDKTVTGNLVGAMVGPDSVRWIHWMGDTGGSSMVVAPRLVE